MKPSEKKKLTTAMQQWLQLKELTASQKEQMDALKEVIEAIAKTNPADFIDGEFLLDGVGLLKYVANPAKVVNLKDGKTLNDILTNGLASELGEKYQKKAINMARLKVAVDAKDRDVMAVLLNYGVELVQGQRLDIKPA